MPPFLIESLQRLGRALMLPIAILPIAGLLLRLGDVDLLDIPLVHDAGKAIFANLALIFAIGIAVGFARDNNGTAGLAGAIGYLVMISVLKVIDPGIDMGVLSGIISGLVAGALYNRFKDVKLPEYLAFFGGRRFVPIATGISAVCLGLLFGVIWPPLQQGINGLGQLMLESGSFGAFAFGVLNRLLIVTGLHHILNNLVWFVFGSFTDPETGRVVTGDLARYFAGDPKGGQFMAGMFPVMMFGLPAACLAMYRNARPERRKLIGGLLLSMALTAFLTGVTEPVEFAFMFLAPLLYLLHALLTGLSMALTDLLDIRLGFTFSGGAIDLALGWGRSTHGWMLWPLGLLYAGIYYLVFDFCIRRFNLKTPGREDDASSESGDNAEAERAPAFIRAWVAQPTSKWWTPAPRACVCAWSTATRPRTPSSRPSVRWPWYVRARPAACRWWSAHRPTASPTRSAAPCPSIHNRAKPYRRWAVRTQPKRWCRCRPPSTPPKPRPGSAPSAAPATCARYGTSH
ncbi:putative phosphotransferase system protein [Pseudomonas aeruginosa PA38182]|nr:putative phosphotransferase system protein [Pseudomonas aeruginosa PA38182]